MSATDEPEIEQEVLNLSPDMFENDMDVDCDSDPPESSSKKLKLGTPCWRGVSMYDIYKSLSPWSAPEFPLISPSSVHAVLYHISKSVGTAVGDIPPVPQKGKDLWDKDFVRMPCSSKSLYSTQSTSEGEPIITKRWQIICEALSHKINNSHELQEAILKYNSRYAAIWKFNGLHKLFNSYLDEEESQCFFESTLPAMIKLALQLPELIQCPIPLLRQHHDRSLSLTQQQISCLLANAFFCTFPRRNAIKGKSEYHNYPEINFCRLFQCTTKSVMEKLKCIFNYFRRVTNKVPCGVVTFSRRSVVPSSCPEWKKSEYFVGSIPFHITSEGTIEDDGVGLLQVDFANKFLGGGVLNYGCVQEEIRFVICPELLISMLFTECLKPTESLIMIGCERYNDYTGYSDTFQWSGNHQDMTPFDASGRRRCCVVAIDALFFSNSLHQYKPDMITRELNKAWVGYSHYVDKSTSASDLTLPAVATGNWGCGAFQGSPHLKAIIQLMACCQVRRPIVYYTFGDKHLRDNVINMYNFLSAENVTIGDLYKVLCQFQKLSAPNRLYEFLMQHLKDMTTNCLPRTISKDSSSTKHVEKPSSSGAFIVQNKASSSPQKPGIKGNVSVSTAALEVSGDEAKNQPEDSLPSSVDVEKGLKTSEGQKVLNTKLFDRISHMDESSSAISSNFVSPSKKHGSLSFFDTGISLSSPSLLGKVLNESPSRDSQYNVDSQGTLDKRKSSNKISDYFQRIPKKGL